MSKSVRPKKAGPTRPLIIAVIVAIGIGIWLLKSYFPLIITAVIASYIFRPVYLWINKRVKKDSMAAALTLLVSILVIGIPFCLVVLVTIIQASNIIGHVGSAISSHDLTRLSSSLIDSLNRVLNNVTDGRVSVTAQQLLDQLSKIASSFASFILDLLKSWLGSLGGVISGTILYMYMFTGILVFHEKLIELFKRLNPLGNEVTDLYLSKAGGMTKAMVRGQFIIAIVQGTVSAIVLHFAGLPEFAFFLLVLTFMSIIPLGAGIITIPIGVINILLGNYWQGVLILLNHFIVVTNIDNVLKPKLVPKDVRLHPALLLLSIFAGMNAFGFLGIIVGPVIVILITTTIEVYLKVVHDV